MTTDKSPAPNSRARAEEIAAATQDVIAELKISRRQVPFRSQEIRRAVIARTGCARDTARNALHRWMAGQKVGAGWGGLRINIASVCPHCGRDYLINETIVDGELRCSCRLPGQPKPPQNGTF